jgi:YidC/Oxa1 family membrane protein insertase
MAPRRLRPRPLRSHSARARGIPRPFRIAPTDLLSALFIALFATAVIVMPALGQNPSASGAPTSVAPAASIAAASVAPAPAATATAAPATAIPTVAPVASTTAASPAASVAAAGSPTASAAAASPAATPPPCPNPTAPPATPTPAPQSLAPGQTAAPVPTPAPTPHPNLCPAQPNGVDPISLLAWAFTPIFQVLFMGLAVFYNLFGDVGTAIVALTIVIRLLLVPLFRKQIVSQRRMQMLQPELRAIQVKYKGNRAKVSEEQMKLYRDRGVNPASGCLPAVLQLLLLMPMYQVFSQGLNAPNITSMLQVFGNPVITVTCYDPTNPLAPCINPDVWWLAWLPQITNGSLSFYPGGMPANLPEIFFMVIPGVFGLSLLALASALLQLVQTRMMATQTDDPQQRTQQRVFLILPLFSLIYGWFLPAGLFIYWITTTIFSIVQQYLINGWGGLFPLFGWTPRFAVNHTPRYPVAPLTPRPPEPSPGGTPSAPKRSTTDSAAGTIRPAKGRSSRRGRRR